MGNPLGLKGVTDLKHKTQEFDKMTYYIYIFVGERMCIQTLFLNYHLSFPVNTQEDKKEYTQKKKLKEWAIVFILQWRREKLHEVLSKQISHIYIALIKYNLHFQKTNFRKDTNPTS